MTCTFTNTQRGTIIVAKETIPDGAEGAFDFTGDADGTIGDGETIEVNDLVPGTYTSTELTEEGFDLTSIVCDQHRQDDESGGNVLTKTATFDLDAGETVTCTFTNTQRTAIDIHKEDDADNALAGVEFTVYVDVEPYGGSRDAGDTVVAGTCTTDAAGDCTVDDLAPRPLLGRGRHTAGRLLGRSRTRHVVAGPGRYGVADLRQPTVAQGRRHRLPRGDEHPRAERRHATPLVT